MDIDSVGTFTMCREALEYLKKGGRGRNSSSGGSILNISATLHYTASWYQIHVSAAKAAVDSITRNLALEWGTDYDIRVNEHLPSYKIGDKWDIAMSAIYLVSDAVDGGHWLRNARRLPKEEVKQLSRVVEKRSRETPVGVPSSK
ncbi:hypothetical protein Goshw_013697, partial [Gossypium schwendimanii]|nr:hypothetical protein [Gossypium schwendimanii]